MVINMKPCKNKKTTIINIKNIDKPPQVLRSQIKYHKYQENKHYQENRCNSISIENKDFRI